MTLLFLVGSSISIGDRQKFAAGHGLRERHLIEQAPCQLIDDLQAIIWVCEDKRIPPLIDWRPGSD
jgi:hypothetical protein